MPVYQFTCDSCDHQFELVEKITEAPDASKLKCPKCGATVQQTWEGGNLQWNFKDGFNL